MSLVKTEGIQDTSAPQMQSHDIHAPEYFEGIVDKEMGQYLLEFSTSWLGFEGNEHFSFDQAVGAISSFTEYDPENIYPFVQNAIDRNLVRTTNPDPQNTRTVGFDSGSMLALATLTWFEAIDKPIMKDDLPEVMKGIDQGVGAHPLRREFPLLVAQDAHVKSTSVKPQVSQDESTSQGLETAGIQKEVAAAVKFPDIDPEVVSRFFKKFNIKNLRLLLTQLETLDPDRPIMLNTETTGAFIRATSFINSFNNSSIESYDPDIESVRNVEHQQHLRGTLEVSERYEEIHQGEKATLTVVYPHVLNRVRLQQARPKKAA